MMSEVVYSQIKASLNKQITIIYNGGSQPGKKRDIIPQKLTQREVRAIDLSNHKTKTFLIGKIEIPSGDSSDSYLPYKTKTKYEYENLKQIYDMWRDFISELGWHISLSDNAIYLHRYFKNGKFHKSADIFMIDRSNEPFTYFDGEEFVEETDHYRQRPYYVSAPDFASARTYSNLSKACEIVIEQARVHAPSNQKRTESDALKTDMNI